MANYYIQQSWIAALKCREGLALGGSKVSVTVAIAVHVVKGRLHGGFDIWRGTGKLNHVKVFSGSDVGSGRDGSCSRPCDFMHKIFGQSRIKRMEDYITRELDQQRHTLI